MKKLFLFEIKEKAAKFLACRKMKDLWRIGFDINELQLKSINPPYYTFEVRKKNGGTRKIEAPEEELKVIQKQLNTYLQCVYYTLQTKAAYGYIIRAKGVRPYKNILENARQHHGATYMLNADFKDFFHQISIKRVITILQTTPFQFEKSTAHILAKLMTRKGKLPMGAPTSPVLSNLATIALDESLTNWAQNEELVYTRFVDDLTFSSKTKQLTVAHFDVIQKIAINHGFSFNTTKTTYYDDYKTKKVTGLLLNDTIDIDPQFYRSLDKNIKRLKTLAEVKALLNDYRCKLGGLA